MKKIKIMALITFCNIGLLETVFAQCIEKQDAVVKQSCNTSPISEFSTIDALYFIPSSDGVLKVGGDVCISMGKQSIQTKELFYNQKEQKLTINSMLTYSDGNQNIEAQSASVNLEKETAELSDQ